jgi:hypothetical protein
MNNLNKNKNPLIEGSYITRIKIWPSDGIKTYFWFQNKKDSREDRT